MPCGSLRSHLYEMELRKRMEKQAEIEGKRKRSNGDHRYAVMCCILTGLVKDLRTSYETSDTQGVLDGDINALYQGIS